MAHSREADSEHSFAETMARLNLLEKQKKTNSRDHNDDRYYKMNHPNRGLAVIFSHEEFTIKDAVRRRGTNEDCDALENVLLMLGFDVIVHRDLTFEEIEVELENVSSNDFDCLLIAVLSHGEQNVLFARDRKYSTNILLEYFTRDRCPSLAGKPKIYIIQACQGLKPDDGVDVRRR